MAKYVYQNFIVDSSAAFLRNTAFDSSIYLKGTSHINAPATVSSGTPTALVLETNSGNDLIIKSKVLGTMAFEASTNYYGKTQVNNLITDVSTTLNTRLNLVDLSLNALFVENDIQDASLNFLNSYRIVMDASIAAVAQQWKDANRSGFVDRNETTLAFTDSTGVLTLNDVGSGWSYYRDGVKITISGNKSLALPSGGSAATGTYFFTIQGIDGALSVSTLSWDLNDPNVLPVAMVIWDATETPKYWIADERHTMLIDRRMHQYLHSTQGTKLISGGILDGPTVGGVGVTDASNAFGVSTTVIADEDIFLTLPALTRPAVPSGNYTVFYRTDASTWTWDYEDTPLSESGGYILYDNNGTMTPGQPGKFYTTYLAYSDLNDAGRYLIIPGRKEFNTIDEAKDEDVATFSFTGLPAKEFVFSRKFIWEASAGYASRGKVALATAPIRVNANLTSVSSATTEAHNDLIGLQGGNSTERYHLSYAQFLDYIGKLYVDSSLNAKLNKAGDSMSGLLTLASAGINLDSVTITNVDTSAEGLISSNNGIPTSGAVKKYVDAQLSSGAAYGWNGLTKLDNSIGLGGALIQATTVTADTTNTLSLAGLLTSTSNTPYAIVEDSVNGALKLRQLGTMTWESSINYVTLPYLNASLGKIDSSIYDIYNRIDAIDAIDEELQFWNTSQDASIVDLRSSQANYVKKSGDTMSGPLTISAGGLTITNDVSISGKLLANNGLIVNNDAFIAGTLTIDGSLIIRDVETIDVSSGFIRINTGIKGTPPPTAQAGIIVGRGNQNPYVFMFDETDDTFRIGIANELTGPSFNDASTQAVSTREDNPNSFGISYWNGANFKFETSTGFNFIPGTGLGLPIASNMASEATALVWNGTTVGSRELGSNAFTSTAYVSQTLFDTSISAIWTKFGNVDTSLNNLGIKNANQDVSINNISLITQSHITSIADLSTNKLDSVASASGGTVNIYSTEVNNIAIIKTLTAGSGTTLTQDGSTVTISVTGVSGYVSKYTGTFNGTSGTSLSILGSTHLLGNGPLQVAVYEGTLQIFADITCAANGDITIAWGSGSLGASCKYIITG